MESLQNPDAHYLRAAQGWLELGDAVSAAEELERIASRHQNHPAVLMVRWHVFAKSKDWEKCYALANSLIELAPEEPMGWIRRSQALHFMKRTPEAWDKLLPALKRFPDLPVVAYDLACYACQLGDLQDAWRWLEKAFAGKDGERFKWEAMQDPDLEPLREKLGELFKLE